MDRSLVLDFDRSVAPPPGAAVLDLSAWQETIRYGCSLADLQRLEAFLAESGLAAARVTFLGSGDFHHVTYSLVRRLAGAGPFQVVAFDNHPDNMRYPWGIHCGSWVRHVCALPFVSKVTVVGITSGDVGWSHLWENHLPPLLRGKLSYLCLARTSRLASRLVRGLVDFSADRARFADALGERLLGDGGDPVYLTIDKDVLAPTAVRTNWDQGILREDELLAAVRRLAPRVFAADVTGEISFFRHARWWKRLLARLDGQSLSSPVDLAALQAAHHDLNLRLLQAITGAA